MNLLPGPRLVAISAATLLGVACAGERAPGTLPAGARNTFVVATPVDLAGVNELVATNTRFTHELLDLLFLRLLEERADYAEHPPSFAPSLAESWELSADRRSLIFRLRADARWSDGRPIRSRDVLFSHEAQTSDEVAWPYAESKSAIQEVVALDERTVLFRLRATNPYLLVDINDGAILPEHAWGSRPFADWRSSADWFRQHLVTSGPYRIASWQPGVELTLAPTAEQLARDPVSPVVVFRVVSDPAALFEQLAAGRFDFADGISPQDASRLTAQAGLKLLASSGRQYDYIGWNGAREPFDDASVRRALTLAIDRQALVDALWFGYARVAAGPIPAEAWARDRELLPWPYDPQRSRELLAAAGFRDGNGDGIVERDGKPLRFELSTNSGNRLRTDALVIIQEQLARVGVDATPRTYELQTLTERNLAGNFDATLAGWSVDTTLDLRTYFHSSEVEQGWNFVRYASSEADALFDALRAESDLEAARPLHHRLQRLLHDEQPYTFLWEPRRLAVARVELAGLEPSPLSTFASLPRWRRVTR